MLGIKSSIFLLLLFLVILSACVEQQEIDALCNSNADCGDANQQFYCEDENVMLRIVSPVCMNPGDVNAHCEEFVSSTLVEACGIGEECREGLGNCQLLCGNGIINVNENCENCPADVQCDVNQACIDGDCISVDQPPEPAEEKKPSVELQINLHNYYFEAGDYLIVYGRGRYRKQLFKVQLGRISEAGYLTYNATFKLFDENAMLVDEQTFQSGTELVFYDESGGEIPLDAALYLSNILMPS